MGTVSLTTTASVFTVTSDQLSFKTGSSDLGVANLQSLVVSPTFTMGNDGSNAGNVLFSGCHVHPNGTPSLYTSPINTGTSSHSLSGYTQTTIVNSSTVVSVKLSGTVSGTIATTTATGVFTPWWVVWAGKPFILSTILIASLSSSSVTSWMPQDFWIDGTSAWGTKVSATGQSTQKQYIWGTSAQGTLGITYDSHLQGVGTANENFDNTIGVAESLTDSTMGLGTTTAISSASLGGVAVIWVSADSASGTADTTNTMYRTAVNGLPTLTFNVGAAVANNDGTGSTVQLTSIKSGWDRNYYAVRGTATANELSVTYTTPATAFPFNCFILQSYTASTAPVVSQNGTVLDSVNSNAGTSYTGTTYNSFVDTVNHIAYVVVFANDPATTTMTYDIVSSFASAGNNVVLVAENISNTQSPFNLNEEGLEDSFDSDEWISEYFTDESFNYEVNPYTFSALGSSSAPTSFTDFIYGHNSWTQDIEDDINSLGVSGDIIDSILSIYSQAAWILGPQLSSSTEQIFIGSVFPYLFNDNIEDQYSSDWISEYFTDEQYIYDNKAYFPQLGSSSAPSSIGSLIFGHNSLISSISDNLTSFTDSLINFFSKLIEDDPTLTETIVTAYLQAAWIIGAGLSATSKLMFVGSLLPYLFNNNIEEQYSDEWVSEYFTDERYEYEINPYQFPALSGSSTTNVGKLLLGHTFWIQSLEDDLTSVTDSIIKAVTKPLEDDLTSLVESIAKFFTKSAISDDFSLTSGNGTLVDSVLNAYFQAAWVIGAGLYSTTKQMFVGGVYPYLNTPDDQVTLDDYVGEYFTEEQAAYENWQTLFSYIVNSAGIIFLNIEESPSFVDTVSTVLEFFLNISDPVSLSDTLSRAWDAILLFEGDPTLVEDWFKDIILGATLESLTGTDELTNLVGKLIAETPTLTEVISKLWSAFKPFAESTTVTDNEVSLSGKNTVEIWTLVDSLQKYYAGVKLELPTLNESVFKVNSMFRVFDESSTFTISTLRFVGVLVSELLSTLESFSDFWVSLRTFLEQPILGFALDLLVDKPLTESSSISDLMLPGASISKLEAILLTPTILKVIGKVINELPVVLEIISRAWVALLSLSSPITVLDDDRVSKEPGKKLTDSYLIFEVLSKIWENDHLITETLIPSDLDLSIAGKITLEIINLTESFVKFPTKLVSELSVLAESLSKLWSAFTSSTLTISLVESTLKAVTVVNLEQNSAIDSFVRNIGKFVVDPLAEIETEIRAWVSLKTVLDFITVLEDTLRKTVQKVVSQTLAVLDTDNNTIFFGTLVLLEAMTFSYSKLVNVTKEFYEGNPVLESFSKSASTSFSSVLSLSESLSRLWSKLLTFTESIAAIETFSRLWAKAVSFSESVGYSDINTVVPTKIVIELNSLLESFQKAYIKLFSEETDVTVSYLKYFTRGFNESLTLLEDNLRVVILQYLEAITTVPTFSFNAAMSIEESISLYYPDRFYFNMTKVLGADLITLIESIVPTNRFINTLDSLLVSDTLSSSVLKRLLDVFNAVDVIFNSSLRFPKATKRIEDDRAWYRTKTDDAVERNESDRAEQRSEADKAIERDKEDRSTERD